MKSILFVFLLPVFAVAQPKKTNTIIIKGVSFDQCINTLMDMGYKIEKIDKDFFTAKTEFKQAENKKIKGWEISIAVRVKGDTAIVTGQHRDYTSKSQTSVGEIYYSPSKLSMDRELFAEIDQYAKSFGKDVAYEIR